MLPLLAFLARTDGRTACDDLRRYILVLHDLQQMNRPLPAMALLTSADRRTVRDHIRCQGPLGCLCKQCQSKSRLVPLLACTDRSVEAHDVTLQPLIRHGDEQSQCPFPLLRLLTSADRCVKRWCCTTPTVATTAGGLAQVCGGRRRGGLQFVQEAAQQSQSRLPLRSLFASRDRRCLQDVIGTSARASGVHQHPRGLGPKARATEAPHNDRELLRSAEQSTAPELEQGPPCFVRRGLITSEHV
mmetsp:Transcript_73082/g.236560  ORF Transcript_73082/g.236560 Transcript_73082/m.236560 type:complete len:244 (+) Transcript_73082:1164-1895(+)